MRIYFATLTGGLGALSLLIHFGVETVNINRQVAFIHNFFCDLKRETVGVVQ